MSLPTPSQSVSHKRFHQCVNHKKKLSLRHPLPTFGSFSFFQASLWLGVDKVLQKLTKSYKSELRHLFQCCILIPRKCPRKTPFQHTVPPVWTGFIPWAWTKKTAVENIHTLNSKPWIPKLNGLYFNIERWEIAFRTHSKVKQNLNGKSSCCPQSYTSQVL